MTALAEYWFPQTTGAPPPLRIAGRETVLLHAMRVGAGWATSTRRARDDEHTADELPGAVLGTLDQLVVTLEGDGLHVPVGIRSIASQRTAAASTTLRRHPPQPTTVQVGGSRQLALMWTDEGWTALVMLVDGLWIGVLTDQDASALDAVEPVRDE